MSSDPSLVWVYAGSSSGAMRSSHDSRSSRALRSAFSCIVKLADVCWMKTVQRPSPRVRDETALGDLSRDLVKSLAASLDGELDGHVSCSYPETGE